MPRRRHRSNDSEIGRTRNRAELRAHIQKLGLQSESDYQRWCKKHGIGDGLYKSQKQKRKERDVASRTHGTAILKRKRGQTRRPRNTLRMLYDKELPKGRLGADYLYNVRSQFASLESDPPARRAFLDLLLAVEQRGKLFGPEPALPQLGELPGNRFIDGLAQIARYHAEFALRPDEWRPDIHNPRRQFGHLARHLLARYTEVPAFMDAAWFGEPGSDLSLRQPWFLHLCAGGNIRTAPGLPVTLSKRMAHLFVQAPDELTIGQALRWAQVVGQDGSPTQARAVLATRLGARFDHEEFWSMVILFFTRNPMLDPAQVGPIVDYIHNQKFVPAERILPNGEVERGDPPQPNFSMKSRSVDKLLGLVDEWHEELAQRVLDPFDDGAPRRRGSKRRNKHLEWEQSEIGEFEHEEVGKSGERTHWQLRELRSNRVLAAEGRAMHHCVASQVKSCRNGSSTIWSLSARVEGKRIPVLTIAVDPRMRTITEVRGKYNASIFSAHGRRSKNSGIDRAYARLLARAQPVMERWMSREGLHKGA